ncbi:hypothetical protein CYMTET_26186, partial [Cymbomonas tetramitiformis]
RQSQLEHLNRSHLLVSALKCPPRAAGMSVKEAVKQRQLIEEGRAASSLREPEGYDLTSKPWHKAQPGGFEKAARAQYERGTKPWHAQRQPAVSKSVNWGDSAGSSGLQGGRESGQSTRPSSASGRRWCRFWRRSTVASDGWQLAGSGRPGSAKLSTQRNSSPSFPASSKLNSTSASPGLRTPSPRSEPSPRTPATGNSLEVSIDDLVIMAKAVGAWEVKRDMMINNPDLMQDVAASSSHLEQRLKEVAAEYGMRAADVVAAFANGAYTTWRVLS